MDSPTLREDRPEAGDVPAIDPVRQPEAERPASSERPRIKTFDVFDTLIARRCVEPFRVFDMVGDRAGLAGFTEARRGAEASVAHQPHDLDTIYAALSNVLGLTEQQREHLKALEIACEIENVMPVAENIAAVSDGDVMISDMYLGAEAIRRLLDAAGFVKKAALVVTSDGKHSGRIWPQMLERFAIEEHLGDNLHSDNLMPRGFGIQSRHTAVTAPNVVEKTLFDIGLRDLGSLCRETRLATWSDDTQFRSLQVIQASMNLPILVLGSIALARLAREQDIESLLFSSRDCDLWLRLYRVVAAQLGIAGECEYFYTSRLTRTRPSADYLAYAAERITPGTLVVDVCGTGWSLAHLFSRLDLMGQQMFLLHRLPAVALYEQHASTPTTSTIHTLMEGVEDRCQNMSLEMCNYAEHGMVTDVCRIGRAALPVFAPDHRAPRLRAAVAAQRASFLKGVAILEARGLRECLTLGDADLKTLCTALYQGLSQQQALYAAFLQPHLDEDATVMRALRGA